MVHPIIAHLFAGFNGTVMCYGQTGSGKTYTVSGTAEDPGLVSPRSRGGRQRRQRRARKSGRRRRRFRRRRRRRA